jgi:hypothetical protein
MAQRQRKGNTLAEFPVALLVLVCFVFPVISLVVLACGAATAYFITVEAASSASVARNFDCALSAMTSKANQLSGGIAKWCMVKPVGGYNNCGIDLYILSVNCFNHSIVVAGPNCQLPEPIDPSTYIYEFQTVGTFDVGPLLNGSSMSYFDDVPVLGKPARLRFTGERAVENPKILEGPGTLAFNGTGHGGNGGPNGGNGTPHSQPFNGLNNQCGPGIGWNFPNGFVFHTMVPVNNGAGGAYLITISETMWSGNVGGGMKSYYVSTSGQYIQPSRSPTIAMRQSFSTPHAYGFSAGTGTNPGCNFSLPAYVNDASTDALRLPDANAVALIYRAEASDPQIIAAGEAPMYEALADAWQNNFIPWGLANHAIIPWP